MLAFDALLVDCRPYTSEKISSVFDLFVPLGIKKFFFIYDVDLAHDNSFYRAEAIDRFKSLSSSLSPRGVHAYIVYRLSLDDSISKNPELRKFFSSKKLYAVRSLYASGADGVILTPRNWMGVAGVVARSSAGTSELINMFISTPENAVAIFKSKGYRVICAGIRDSVSIFDADLSKPIFVVLGGEKRGISRALLDMADSVVRIDYGTEFNGSLSTAAASAVFAFEIFRNNR